jgi:hypothetical protein
VHRRDTLLAGFTTCATWVPKGAGYADVSRQARHRRGLIPGPRLFVTTRAIVASSSYGPGPHGFRPDIESAWGAQEVSGRDEATAPCANRPARRGLDQGLCRLPHRHGWQRATHFQA